jgi:hypothetical protein
MFAVQTSLGGEDLERGKLEAVAAGYTYLRGLFLIPAGVVIVLSGLTNMEWVPSLRGWLFVGAVSLAGLTSWGIARYYARTYGRVVPLRVASVRVALVTVAGALVVVGGVQLDWSLDLPVGGTVAAFALVMLVSCVLTLGVRAHQVIIWGALLAVALLPLWGGASGDVKINAGLVLVGVTTALAGIFDHRALGRAFESLGSGHAGSG